MEKYGSLGCPASRRTMKFINQNRKTIIRLFAWLQIVGGITGLFLIAKFMLLTGQITGPILLIFVTGLALFMFSIFAGRDLLRSNAKKNHFTLTLINQALQAVHGSMLGWGLTYTSGANFSIGVASMAFKFNISFIMSTFSMTINSAHAFGLHINLFAIAVILILIHYKERAEEGTKAVSSELNENVSERVQQINRN